MKHDLKIIHISDESDIARILGEAEAQPVRLERNGMLYRLSREPAPSAHYDPEAIKVALRSAAGTLTPEEADALKAYVHRAREEGNRPATCP